MNDLGALNTSPAGQWSRRRAALVAMAVAALGLTCWIAAFSPFSAHAAADKPNVVFLLTDDQTLDEMVAMPNTNALIGGQGATFKRAYISYPLCCPSRAAILSGQYMHNNGVRGNAQPEGGWPKFFGNGTEAKALPTWLQAEGYYDVLVGKYLNGYGGIDPPTPPGWNEWYGKVSEYDENLPGFSIYYNYHLREDPPAVGGVPCPSGDPAPPGDIYTCTYGEAASDYQTDVFGDKAVEAIHRVSSPTDPFFLSVDFNSPHSPYIPAPRHTGLYHSAQLKQVAGLNEVDIRDKPRFIRRLPKLGKGKLGQIETRRRSRLEMLLSVDERVKDIVDALDEEGQLDNTYIVFMSDNGYFSGEHRIRQGKYLPYEPSSHVPLLIRGPGIPAGVTSNELVSNVDIAPTIAAMTGATPTLEQDGRSILPYAASPTTTTGRPIVLEGDTGQGIDDEGSEAPGALGDDPADDARVKAFHKKLKRQKKKLRGRCRRLNRESPRRALLCFRRGVTNIDQEPTDKTYKLRAPAYVGLRTSRYALYLYATGEVELYDMSRDPGQVNGLQKNPRYKPVLKSLLAQLPAYKDCQGAECRRWVTEPKPLKKRKPKTKPKKKPGSKKTPAK